MGALLVLGREEGKGNLGSCGAGVWRGLRARYAAAASVVMSESEVCVCVLCIPRPSHGVSGIQQLARVAMATIQ
jgi:hypothetical protein